MISLITLLTAQMVEIERKFLVKSMAFKEQAHSRHRVSQGYLNSDPERTVRIRIMGESGFLTIKGKSSESGTTRLEWETEISLADAKPLLAICENGIIDKMRHLVHSGRHTFEVDEFFGENEGLFIAEIELSSEDEKFEKPDWLGEEITADHRYYNAYLKNHPYKTW